MRLVTPANYVNQYGVTETGRLLSNKGVINPSGDDRSDYVLAMYVSGKESNEIKDTIKTELNRYIDQAENETVPHFRRYLVWPLQIDGFLVDTADVPSEIQTVVLEVMRYYLHDEDTRHVEDVSYLERRYQQALRRAERIGDGEFKVDADSKFDDKIVYTL